MKTKRRTYETYILPSVLYGIESITFSPASLEKLNIFENKIMRWMTNNRLNDRVPITQLRSLTKLKPITREIKIRKLKWYGHLRRCDHPIKNILEGLVEGKRQRGRPKRRWMQDIYDWTNFNINRINRIVRDRPTWRSVCYSIT